MLSSVHSRFFGVGAWKYWSVFVHNEPVFELAGSRPENLTDAAKACYNRLREWQKEKAEGIRSYLTTKGCRCRQLREGLTQSPTVRHGGDHGPWVLGGLDVLL